jgi:hypothetical protein
VFLYWIVPKSRSFSVVVVQQATESLQLDQWAIGPVIVGPPDKRTAETLVRAIYVVVSHVLADEISQVRLTEWDDAVEALFFDRSNEAFDERAQIRAATRHMYRFRSGVPEHLLSEILRGYVACYNNARPHGSLQDNSPMGREVEPSSRGPVISIPQVGGLHHRHTRAA